MWPFIAFCVQRHNSSIENLAGQRYMLWVIQNQEGEKDQQSNWP